MLSSALLSAPLITSWTSTRSLLSPTSSTWSALFPSEAEVGKGDRGADWQARLRWCGGGVFAVSCGSTLPLLFPMVRWRLSCLPRERKKKPSLPTLAQASLNWNLLPMTYTSCSLWKCVKNLLRKSREIFSETHLKLEGTVTLRWLTDVSGCDVFMHQCHHSKLLNIYDWLIMCFSFRLLISETCLWKPKV